MPRSCMFALPSLVLLGWISAAADSAEPFRPATKVAISRGSWTLNGKPTYPGARAEGLLLNVRVVQAVFEDRNPATRPKGFDADKNTDSFVAMIPEYVRLGARAFTLNLQGGPPGYEGALCSAFEADGSLRPDFLARVARVIEACDRAGAAVILGCLDPGQDQVLKDEEAVKKAIAAAAAWVRDRGYTNVLLEVANEQPHKDYQHEIIRDPERLRELILLARKTAPNLLISASGGPGGRLDHAIATSADFLLLHLSKVPVEEILERVASADKVSKAIVCNEDNRTGEEGARALEASVAAVASWGYANQKQNGRYPFSFKGAEDDARVYAKLEELTTPGK